MDYNDGELLKWYFLYPVVVWAIATVFVIIHIPIEEALGRSLPLETSLDPSSYNTMLQLYNWLGGFGWASLHLLVCIVFQVVHNTDWLPGTFLTPVLSFALWGTIASTGFVEPNKSWRKLERAEDGLASGGEDFRGCHLSPNPLRLTIEPNISWYILMDREWTVNMDNKTEKSSWGWSYVTAPIVYTGPVEDCKFEPAIYAYCIVKSPATMEKCGFNRNTPGLTISKLRASAEVETVVFNSVPWNTTVQGDKKEQLFEFDSYTRYENTLIVEKIKDDAVKQWSTLPSVWGIVTMILLLIALVPAMIKISPERITIPVANSKISVKATDLSDRDNDDGAVHDTMHSMEDYAFPAEK